MQRPTGIHKEGRKQRMGIIRATCPGAWLGQAMQHGSAAGAGQHGVLQIARHGLKHRHHLLLQGCSCLLERWLQHKQPREATAAATTTTTMVQHLKQTGRGHTHAGVHAGTSWGHCALGAPATQWRAGTSKQGRLATWACEAASRLPTDARGQAPLR